MTLREFKEILNNLPSYALDDSVVVSRWEDKESDFLADTIYYVYYSSTCHFTEICLKGELNV